ncbi:MAG: hypothetical protein JXB47_17590 [Anaerolineae bacterium]|nr:hypothetical protein [Anaerolineae bacterium]
MDADALSAVIARLWVSPTPADLWALHAPLLALDVPGAHAAREVAGKFYAYLNALEHKLTSQRYTRFAAILEASAVTTVGFENVLRDRKIALGEVLVAGLAGALEVMAAMQGVRAWKTDTRAEDLEAAWEVYGLLWEVSAQMQPGLSPDERAAYLERVFAPVVAPDTPDAVRAALIVRLHQLLLILRLLALLRPDAG